MYKIISKTLKTEKCGKITYSVGKGQTPPRRSEPGPERQYET